VDHIRLFRNHPKIRWRYRVHEQILPAIRETGGEVRWADVVIRHIGYTDPQLRKRKLQRDLRLLEIEHHEQPQDPFTLFNLGSVLQEIGQYAKALPLLRESLNRSHPADSIVRKLYALIANCHLHLRQINEALRVCHDGLTVCPDDQELLFLESIIRTEQGDYAGAKAVLVRLLSTQAGQHFASVADGLRGHRGRHQLAVVCFRQGEFDEARMLWQAVLRDRPTFLQARVGLAELALTQLHWQELEEMLAGLDKHPTGALDATMLRGKALLARQEYAQARTLVEQALQRYPSHLPLLTLLSHILLQEDKDPAQADRVLCAILERDPANAQAKHNLQLLRGRLATA
jgi:tetratricopeptide (TPR) repeat protein